MITSYLYYLLKHKVPFSDVTPSSLRQKQCLVSFVVCIQLILSANINEFIFKKKVYIMEILI